MTSASPSLLPCLAAAAASGVVSLDEAIPYLNPYDTARPYWPAVRRGLKRCPPERKAGSGEVPVSEGGRVLWRGRPIGTLVELYRDALPQEQQARIAYDTFLTRFFDYLYVEHYCVALSDNDAAISLFVPADQPPVLPDLWNAFIAHAFSLPELRRTFLAVLNAVKLSGRGFSPPDVPPVTRGHAVALLGLYNATVRQRDIDIKMKRKRIEDASGAGERERLRRELAKNEADYRLAITNMAALIDGLPDDLPRQVREATDGMTRTGRSQIGPRPDYITACVDRAQAVVDRVNKGQFAHLRPLLSAEPPLQAARMAGDANSKGPRTCYICGVVLDKKEGVEVSKLVVEKPSQALQSRPREARPLACPTCVQVSTLSPIKPTDEAVIVSLRSAEHKRYLYDDHLRQLALGELNLVAGRYCQITCAERVEGRDPLSQKLGALQYALLKTAHLFPADSLRDYAVVVSVDGGEIETPRRQTTALGGLLAILGIAPSHVAAKKSNLGTFSDAVRLLQADRYIEATYELLGAFRRGPNLNVVATTRLDALAGVIIDTWQEDLARHRKETGRMTDVAQETQSKDDAYLRSYRDVLALTGLIVPFVRQVQNSPSGSERELKKLIEHVETEPTEFCYDLAQALQTVEKAIPSARMYDGRTVHTIVIEALLLLREAGIDVVEQKSVRDRKAVAPKTSGDGNQEAGPVPETDSGGVEGGETASTYYPINIDMLQGVYLYLYSRRYRTPKQRRDLAYQLKLSLYARFPRLVSTAD